MEWNLELANYLIQWGALTSFADCWYRSFVAHAQ